jgi:hypothetical protein
VISDPIVGGCDFDGLSTKDTKDLCYFGRSSSMSSSDIIHVRMLNQVLIMVGRGERERVVGEH